MGNFEMLKENATGGSTLLSIFFVVILAPIGEECLYRGLIQKKIMKWLPVVPAIILQALFFGISHLNIVQGIYATVFGIAAGYVAYRYKSILPTIFIYAVNNATALLVGYLQKSAPQLNILWIVMPFILLAVLVLVIKFMPGKLMEARDTETENLEATAIPVMAEANTVTKEV